MKQTNLSRLITLVSILIFVIGNASISPAAAVPTPQRTVLAEYFTATWCVPCTYAEPALSMLFEKYGPTKFVMLEYHVNDEISNSKTESRSLGYGVPGFPTVIFDGIVPISGVAENMQSYYDKNIQKRLAIVSKVTLTISGVIGEQTGLVKATITQINPITSSNLKLRWVIAEDNVNVNGKYHRFVVRNILTEDQVKFQGTEPVIVDKTFAVNPVWNYANLRLVVFIQDDKTKEVLQTTVVKTGKKVENKK
ncbi:MAG: hypothetical protein ACE14V_08855 [bacterium]